MNKFFQRGAGRLLTLLALGIVAGWIEFGLLYLLADGQEAVHLSRMAHAAALGLGLAALAGVPRRRAAYSFTWSVLGAFVCVTYYFISPLVARMFLGAFLGFGMLAVGPSLPLPWLAALRGAFGASVAAVVAHYALDQGLPGWLLPGLQAVVLGICLAPSRAEQVPAILADEIEQAQVGGPVIRGRVRAIVNLAVRALEEVEERQERTGEDVAPARGMIMQTAVHLLGLMRRVATLPPHAAHLAESLAAQVDWEEGQLAAVYCQEVAAMMAVTIELPSPPAVRNQPPAGAALPA